MIECPNCGEWWEIEPISQVESNGKIYEVIECKNCGHRWVQILP